MAKLRQLGRVALYDQRVALDRDTNRDDVLDVGEASTRRPPDDRRRQIHQSAPLMPRRRDHRQMTARRENVMRIFKKPAKLWHG
ncbi:hypothetical protein [Nonomuraea bangladeshensis]|uniref:hypothetical protein n=1 Tax=Nonomuraea bangladeshensis TaxID=404385 RepID=UPI0031CFA589